MAVPALLLWAGLPGCKSPEEKLVDLRTQLRDDEDALYQLYGGSELAASVEGAARSAGGGGIMEAAANLARDADRLAFMADCTLLGSGGRPKALSDKARAFFAQPVAKDGCRTLVQLSADIAALERSLGRGK